MVEGFEWDPDKARANLRKHGVSFADAAKVFDEFSRSEWLDERADYGEDRFITVGEVSGRVLVIAYSMRGDSRRIIMARKATKRETREHHGNREA